MTYILTIPRWLDHTLSIVIFGAVSVIAAQQISHIIAENKRNDRTAVNVAYYATILAGVIIAYLTLKQNYLTECLGRIEVENKVQLYGVYLIGMVFSVLVWQVRNFKKYGDWLYIFLLTISVCFSWFARFFSPDKRLLHLILLMMFASLITFSYQQVKNYNNAIHS